MIFLSIVLGTKSELIIPVNQNVKCEIVFWAVKRGGFYLHTKYVVVMENNEVWKNDIDRLIQYMDSSQYDFSANLILYSITNKDASLLMGHFGSEIIGQEGTINSWRENMKASDKLYWIENRQLIIDKYGM